MSFKNILHTLLLSLCCIGCSDNEGDLPHDTPLSVSFRSVVTTRAAQLLSDHGESNTDQLKEFGVYANLDGITPFMGDATGGQIVRRIGTGSEWEYAPASFWPSNGYLDFYAYAPIGNDERTTGPGTADEKRKRTILPGLLPVIDFVVDSYAEFQTDLLLAVPQRYQTKRDYVILPMRHMLTRITFSARIDEDLAQYAPDVAVKVDQIVLKDIHRHGTHSLDATDSWVLDLSNPAHNHRFMLERIPTTVSSSPELTDDVMGVEYKNISTRSGTLLMLPQPMSEEHELEVTYRIMVPGRVDAFRTYTIALADHSPDWGQGDALNYQLLLRNREVVLTIFGLPGSPGVAP